MSYATMKKLEERYKAEVERWFAEAERIDREEDELYGADKSGDELPEWVSNKEERLKRIRQAKAELEAEAKAAAALVNKVVLRAAHRISSKRD